MSAFAACGPAQTVMVDRCAMRDRCGMRNPLIRRVIGVAISFRQTSAWAHCHQNSNFGRLVIEGREWGHRVNVDQDFRWDQ